MSTTVNLNIYTAPYPTISNNIEIRLYAQSADTAVVAAVNHAGPHTLVDTWSFPGLPITNYLFRIFEMSGSTIVRELGQRMDVVPSAASGVNSRSTEQIEADVTIGFVSGVNIVTFDGTAGAANWRGWDIDTIDRIGTGPMKRNVDYTWNITTGALTLLNPGDVFAPNEWFNVQFAIQTNVVVASVPTTFPLFSTPKLVTAHYVVNVGTDMGGLLIADPASTFMQIDLPDLTTVVPGKLLTIEMRRTSVNKCCKLSTFSSNIIDWLHGSRNDLYLCPQESISIYRFIDPGGSSTGMWRVFNPFGNWLHVGDQVGDDNTAANVFNKILLAGGDGDTLALARFYNDYVLQLPGGQVVNYDDWTTGNNKYKFSLANSANPANAGKFKIADRSNIFERITDGTRLPGDYQGQQMVDHRHEETIGSLTPTLFGKSTITRSHGIYNGQTNGVDDFTGPMIDGSGNTIPAGAELRPGNIAIRKYVYV